MSTLGSRITAAGPKPITDLSGMFPGPDGSYWAVNPATGQPEPVVADTSQSDMSGGNALNGAVFYFASEAPQGPNITPLTIGQGNGLGDLVGGALGLIGGTAAFGVGGLTGASPFTGMDPQQALMLDGAGLALGTGLGASGVLDAGALAAGTGDAAILGGTGGDTLGAGFTGGLTGTATGTPGLSGAAVGSTGLSAAGGGTLAPGAFAAESLYPVAGGLSAATASTPLAYGGAPSFMSGLTGLSPGALSAGGTLAGVGLGLYGINQQVGALEGLSNQENARFQTLFNAGQPYRDQLAATFQPGFNVNSIPGLQGAMDTSYQSLLRGLSTQGNPFGNPGGLMEAQNYVMGNVALPATQQYRNFLANAGGLGQFASGAAQGPNLGPAMAGINSSGNAFNVIGAGIADLTRQRNPFMSPWGLT
jgi:hypothetical protein